MIAASPAEQQRLLALQEIDSATRLLTHKRANLAEQQALDANTEELQEVGVEHATTKEQVQRLAVQQQRHETEIAAVDSRRKSEEGRMYSGLVTSEREVEALRAELSSLKARKRDLEDTLLEVMEQREDLDAKLAKLKARHTELTSKVAELTIQRDSAATDIDVELLDYAAAREAAVNDISPDVYQFYNDLRAKKGVVAVAQLQGRTCLGCRLEITAIEYEQVLRDAQHSLARCEQCGRILVPAPRPTPQAHAE